MSNQLLLRRRMMVTNKEPNYLTFISKQDGSNVKLNRYDIPYLPHIIPIEYRINKGIWQPYNYGSDINLNNKDNVQFRNSSDIVYSGFTNTNNAYVNFSMSGIIEAEGSIMSLLDKTCNATIISRWGLYNLFNNCTSLVKAPLLTATDIEEYGYRAMFNNCSNLIYVKTFMKNLESNAIQYWLDGNTNYGSLYCYSSLSLVSGGSGKPNRWTRYNID